MVLSPIDIIGMVLSPIDISYRGPCLLTSRSIRGKLGIFSFLSEVIKTTEGQTWTTRAGCRVESIKVTRNVKCGA
jgi:hypothetical protein